MLRPRPATRRLRVPSGTVWDLLATLGTSVVCVLVAETWFKSTLGVDEDISTLDVSVLALGVLVTWMVSLLLLAVTGSRLVTCLGLGLGTALLAVANQYKTDLRAEPLFPTDVAYVGETRLILDSAGIPLWAVAAAALALLAALVVWLVRRRRRSTGPGIPAWLRVSYAVVGLAAVSMTLFFNDDHNPLRRAYEATGTEWVEWNQWNNYQVNGFIAGLLSNMPAAPMERPDGYDAGAVEALAEKYAERAAAINRHRDPDALRGTNVVVVLSESFSDPTRIDGLELGEDPIPFTRRLMARNPSGSLVSTGYGGGTANMEFEILTGLSTAHLRAQARTPFQSLLPGRRAFPSLVRSIAGAEHRRGAIHPFAKTSYRRRSAYPALGLRHLTFDAEMRHQDRLGDGHYISDEAVFREVVEDLEASEAPIFLNVVTMQNHAPYDAKYPDPVEVRATADDGEVPPAAGQYLRGLRHSDDALRRLVADVEALDEPTVVLLYGDHLPAVWPERVIDAEPEVTQFRTPWVVFGNTDLEEVEETGPIGPPHLLGRLLAATDAPVTPMDAFLDDLREEVPAATPQLVLDADRRVTDRAGLSPEARALLKAYRLIEYDQVEGRSPAADDFYAVPPTR